MDSLLLNGVSCEFHANADNFFPEYKKNIPFEIFTFNIRI